jgi:general stress protein 26
MSDSTITLDEVKAFATNLSPWAHLASVGADGKPDVVPVHPCWEGDVCWSMIGSDSVKARNVAAHADVAMHWQVTAVGDGVELWGTAEVFADIDTKRRLWTGVFDYDLNAFAPGGPEDSPGTAFLAIRPERALVLYQYGMGGLKRWSA